MVQLKALHTDQHPEGETRVRYGTVRRRTDPWRSRGRGSTGDRHTASHPTVEAARRQLPSRVQLRLQRLHGGSALRRARPQLVARERLQGSPSELRAVVVRGTRQSGWQQLALRQQGIPHPLPVRGRTIGLNHSRWRLLELPALLLLELAVVLVPIHRRV
jgi:hypothetical protein